MFRNARLYDCLTLTYCRWVDIKTEQLEASLSAFDIFFHSEQHSRSYMHIVKCDGNTTILLLHSEPRAESSPSACPYLAVWAPPWCHGSEAWWSWPEKWTCSLGWSAVPGNKKKRYPNWGFFLNTEKLRLVFKSRWCTILQIKNPVYV